MPYQPEYYYGQGKVFLAKRDAAGNPLVLRWLGDVDDLKVSLKTTPIKRKEAWSGEKTTSMSLIVDKDASVDMTLMDFSNENLNLALYGKSITSASGSVTGERLPTGLLVGDRVRLENPLVSSVVITDSATTPATVNPSKYEIDPKYGALTVKDATGLTQPLVAAYSHGAIDTVAMFAVIPDNVFLRYEGINLAQGGAPVIVELYCVKTEPLKELSLITDKQGDMKISAEVLGDTTKPADAEMGRFGRILQVSSA
ncbi:hypothetical protein [Undibacterium sp. TC9W]|uniref:phage tail tube protein n=1 Tax=Undibacterium sp. TC9W TaxID=3413053 RepID=UPI003BF0F620